MDNPVYTDIAVSPISPPPSYLEASACPPHPTEVPSTPPPAYTPGSYLPSYCEIGTGKNLHTQTHTPQNTGALQTVCCWISKYLMTNTNGKHL